MSQKIEKLNLEWSEEIEEVCNYSSDPNIEAWEEQTVMRAEYKDFLLTVFEVKDKYGGFEYEILFPEGDKREKYDSFFDSYMGGDDHAKTKEEAMKWAENTLKDFLEEDDN